MNLLLVAISRIIRPFRKIQIEVAIDSNDNTANKFIEVFVRQLDTIKQHPWFLVSFF